MINLVHNDKDLDVDEVNFTVIEVNKAQEKTVFTKYEKIKNKTVPYDVM